MESARRASEIHKRRTGRSLRVTEQDVVNEEMYEEEDDDLPGQYRRLTAHLQTSNPMFNSRLAAYLTNNVAMRRALEQTIQDSYTQQFSAQGQQYNPQQSFPSPMLAYPGQQSMMYPPQSPNSYRTAPYPPRPQQQQFQSSQHQRSASIAAPQEVKNAALNSPLSQADNGQRMSMPAVPASTNSPVQTRAPMTPVSATGTLSPQPQMQPQMQPQKPSFPPGSFSLQFGTQPAPAPAQPYDTSFNSNFPFTTQLSGNVQGLLGDTLDLNDPFNAQLMSGSGTLPGTFYDFSTTPQLPATTNVGKQQTHPSFNGLTSTLAPAALEPQQGNDFDTTYFNDAFKAGTTEETPIGTPGGNNDWSSFFDTAAWDQPASQPTE